MKRKTQLAHPMLLAMPMCVFIAGCPVVMRNPVAVQMLQGHPGVISVTPEGRLCAR